MISIGGVIGAGLFVGSGAVVHSAGPGSIVSYALAGLLVVFVMRMLGEMAAINPTSGSFATYAREAIGPWAGYTIGWLYWFFWVIVIAIDSRCWYYSILDSRNPTLVIKPNINDFINIDECFSVKSFGEFEYWFSFIKVISIILFLCLGLAVILGFVPGTEAPGTSNLVGQGGFMPNGISSVLLGITVVIFSFMGSEIVAVAAGESAEPVKAVKQQQIV